VYLVRILNNQEQARYSWPITNL